jgi:hypothetical protein
MMLQALLDPDDLMTLKDRDVFVLSAVIKRELLTNQAIQQELSGKVEPLARRMVEKNR